MLFFTNLVVIVSIVFATGCNVVNSSTSTDELKDPAPIIEAENSLTAPMGSQVAVFAGGCFWGVEAVFEHVKGVIDVKSGYAGGDAKTANYEKVSNGKTEHAESVKVTFDPAKVTYSQLLAVFFSVAHDPTQLNRQGPDTGSHYRSAIFYVDEEQMKSAQAYIAGLDESKSLPKPVVTQVVPLEKFHDAEKYHQDYLALHPNQPYIVMHDLPKLAELKKKYADLYKEK